MSGYITITPKYEPLDLDTMLKVPMALQEQREKQEDKLNAELDKLAAIKAMSDESTDYRLADYNNSVDQTIDALVNRKGTIGDAVALMNRAKGQYRDLMPIINAYEKKQKVKDMIDQIRAKDPTARFTQLNNLESWITNPNDQDWWHFSGDDLYKEAITSAAKISADRKLADNITGAGREGFVKINQKYGYTPEEQKHYANLINTINNADKNSEEYKQALNELETPLYNQLFEDYKTKIQDNLNRNYIDEDIRWGKDKILAGQLVGMELKDASKIEHDPLASVKWQYRQQKKDAEEQANTNKYLLYRKINSERKGDGLTFSRARIGHLQDYIVQRDGKFYLVGKQPNNALYNEFINKVKENHNNNASMGFNSKAALINHFKDTIEQYFGKIITKDIIKDGKKITQYLTSGPVTTYETGTISYKISNEQQKKMIAAIFNDGDAFRVNEHSKIILKGDADGYAFSEHDIKKIKKDKEAEQIVGKNGEKIQYGTFEISEDFPDYVFIKINNDETKQAETFAVPSEKISPTMRAALRNARYREVHKLDAENSYYDRQNNQFIMSPDYEDLYYDSKIGVDRDMMTSHFYTEMNPVNLDSESRYPY